LLKSEDDADADEEHDDFSALVVEEEVPSTVTATPAVAAPPLPLISDEKSPSERNDEKMLSFSLLDVDAEPRLPQDAIEVIDVVFDSSLPLSSMGWKLTPPLSPTPLAVLKV